MVPLNVGRMKIDFSKKLFTRTGEPVKQAADSEQLSGKDAVIISLDYLDNDSRLTPDQKYKRYRAQLKMETEDADWTSEEVVTMKEAVGQYPWFPHLHGILCDLLDQKEVLPPSAPKLEVVG